MPSNLRFPSESLNKCNLQGKQRTDQPNALLGARQANKTEPPDEQGYELLTDGAQEVRLERVAGV